jgi:hypothetical protein
MLEVCVILVPQLGLEVLALVEHALLLPLQEGVLEAQLSDLHLLHHELVVEGVELLGEVLHLKFK